MGMWKRGRKEVMNVVCMDWWMDGLRRERENMPVLVLHVLVEKIIICVVFSFCNRPNPLCSSTTGSGFCHGPGALGSGAGMGQATGFAACPILVDE